MDLLAVYCGFFIVIAALAMTGALAISVVGMALLLATQSLVVGVVLLARQYLWHSYKDQD